MTKVTFEYDIDEMVETPLKARGMVEMLALDSSGTKKVYVQFQSGQGDWYKESTLKKVPKI